MGCSEDVRQVVRFTWLPQVGEGACFLWLGLSLLYGADTTGLRQTWAFFSLRMGLSQALWF